MNFLQFDDGHHNRTTDDKLPLIRLATFHQEISSILDQILHLRLLFKALGFRLSVAPSFDTTSLNLMLEDFQPSTCETIERFRQETGKRIAIIATEHLDYDKGRVFAYGEPLFETENNQEYIAHQERARRFAGLLEAARSSRLMFTLGDYPRLRGVNELLPRVPIVQLPYPPLPMDRVMRRIRRRRRHDFVFTGTITPFRARVLKQIAGEFDIAAGRAGANRRERAKLYLDSSAALNIPQYRGWLWSSPMRVLYGLAMGRITISLLLEAGSEIDRFTCMTEELSVPYLRDTLAALREGEARHKIEAYQAHAEQRARDPTLRKVFLDWAFVEGLI